MNAIAKNHNVIVYCEVEEGVMADVSLELLTKARTLAKELGCGVEALIIGSGLNDAVETARAYGAQRVHVADDPRLRHYLTLPFSRITCSLFRQIEPQVALFGATSVGRDLAPRVSSELHSGLTADCTSLEIGAYKDAKSGREYANLLFQIRPAFGGNIIATIVNPDCRPQMATVREGVMRREPVKDRVDTEIVRLDVKQLVSESDFVVEILQRHVERGGVNIKGAPIIISGGYGVGSKEGFDRLHVLAKLLGAEVGASRAAVDAGFAEHARQVGQTGVTVRPKLYIAVGISGQVQHTAGMSDSSVIISINSDPDAPINRIADYVVVGDWRTVVDSFIESFQKHTK